MYVWSKYPWFRRGQENEGGWLTFEFFQMRLPIPLQIPRSAFLMLSTASACFTKWQKSLCFLLTRECSKNMVPQLCLHYIRMCTLYSEWTLKAMTSFCGLAFPYLQTREQIEIWGLRDWGPFPLWTLSNCLKTMLIVC